MSTFQAVVRIHCADGTTFQSTVRDEARVGRDSEECAIVVNDPSVSRIHCELRIAGSDLQVCNRSTINPIAINDRALITPDFFQRVAVGDVIQFGNSRMEILRTPMQSDEPSLAHTIAASAGAGRGGDADATGAAGHAAAGVGNSDMEAGPEATIARPGKTRPAPAAARPKTAEPGPSPRSAPGQPTPAVRETHGASLGSKVAVALAVLVIGLLFVGVLVDPWLRRAPTPQALFEPVSDATQSLGPTTAEQDLVTAQSFYALLPAQESHASEVLRHCQLALDKVGDGAEIDKTRAIADTARKMKESTVEFVDLRYGTLQVDYRRARSTCNDAAARTYARRMLELVADPGDPRHLEAKGYLLESSTSRCGAQRSR